MKCPKCGYLGFETTDRCKNCGYDFSLSAAPSAAELSLRGSETSGPFAELNLRSDTLTSDRGLPVDRLRANDPDRLFDDPAPAATPVRRTPGLLPPAAVPPRLPRASAPVSAAAPFEPVMERFADGSDEAAAAEDAAGVDELPLFSPRPAGTPLAVRRSTPEIPRPRRTTTRPLRMEMSPLPLTAEPSPASTLDPAAPVTRVIDRHDMVAAPLSRRVGAAAIDLALLGGIGFAVLWLTLRMAGLSFIYDDVLVLAPVPFCAFLLTLGTGYLVGFTVAGGQTIGKMAAGVAVIGDDGRSVDLAGAVLRALGAVAAVLSCGLLWLPVLLSHDRRALHDRLAGTRVVLA